MTTQTRLGPNLTVHVPIGALRVREFVDGVDPSIGAKVDLPTSWENPFEGSVRLTFFAVNDAEKDLPVGDMEFSSLFPPVPFRHRTVLEWDASKHKKMQVLHRFRLKRKAVCMLEQQLTMK